MMPQSVAGYVRRQGATAAVINMVLNPALAWVINREMGFMTLRSIVSDTAVTSVVLSLLVSLFVTSGVHRDLKAGRIRAADGSSREGRLLSRLPGHAWALGLVIGFGSAFVLAPLTVGLFHVAGIPGLCFARFALFKAVYTGLLGFIVTRWVILRQLLRASRT